MVEALARAASSPFAEVTVVVTPEKSGGYGSPGLWRAYCHADRALFGAACDWSASKDVNVLVPRERRVRRDGEAGTWRTRVQESRLDVAFVMGEVEDSVLDGLARFGTWRFCFGEAQGTREPLAGVREVVEGHAVVASGIRIHRGAGHGDRIACPSWSRAYPFSVTRSRNALFAKTSEFLARALRDLHAGGAAWLERGTEPARERAAERFPSTAALVRDIGRLGWRVAGRAAQKALTVEEWSIAYRFSHDESWDGSLEGFHRLQPPKGWYWADPFPIQVGGRNYIFFEELPLGAAKAHISVVEVDRDGRASAPRKVLERDYHLSYPFLVEEGGRLYMIPETAHNNTVEVYRCEEFPAKWKLERVLMKDVFCADATLHREADRWWMFANSARPGEDINDELHLFSAETLLGDWKPHRRNPVKSDVRSARPAGRLFRQGARLMRPGQIGAPHYGAGIALHEVERLTPDEYVEREDKRIVPRSESVLGIHTINRAGDLSVTDAFSRRPRF
ncbi:MAG TPA: hypothetical protein VEC19_08395 [Usitatibacter sp.]|nr:hypothetical protein [Usitatibacter sp.]